MDLGETEPTPDSQTPPSEVIARTRWKLLAKVLKKSNSEDKSADSCSHQLVSVSTTSRELYGLFNWQLIDNKSFRNDDSGHWLQCSSCKYPNFSLNVRFLINQFSINELTGFNNTGNICVWPSEEVLAYYCLKNTHLFKKKAVLELGGGMTCLASLTVATTSDPTLVSCTDGNPASVENVKRIIQYNNLNTTRPVTAQVLDWKNESTFKQMESRWEVVLCADCLFFDDGREALVETMSRITTNDGLILIMAPRRGRTLNAFLELCQGKFDIYLQEEFDSHVTLSHQKKTLCPDYNSDHNYPLLVQLRKR